MKIINEQLVEQLENMTESQQTHLHYAQGFVERASGSLPIRRLADKEAEFYRLKISPSLRRYFLRRRKGFWLS